MTTRWRTVRNSPLRTRLAAVLVVAAFSGVVAAGALAQSRQGKLIGKLEGPEVVTDASKFPKTFKEAPQLAELVKAGKLPPVAERIGQDPLVIKPLNEIGKYGGTWRAGFTGPADFWNGFRCCSGPDHLMFWDYTGDKAMPNLAKGLEMQDDGRAWLVHLRRGHEVERRQAVHRRRLRVLVRGHLPEQGPRPDALGDDGHQRQAGRDREGRHAHGAVQVPRAVLHVPRRAGRLDRSRRPVGSPTAAWAASRRPTT